MLFITPCLSRHCHPLLLIYCHRDAGAARVGKPRAPSPPLEAESNLDMAFHLPFQPAEEKVRFSSVSLVKGPWLQPPETPNDLRQKPCGLNWFDFVGWQTFQCSVWTHAGPVYKLNKRMTQGFLIPKWLAREKSRGTWKVMLCTAPGEQTCGL